MSWPSPPLFEGSYPPSSQFAKSFPNSTLLLNTYSCYRRSTCHSQFTIWINGSAPRQSGGIHGPLLSHRHLHPRLSSPVSLRCCPAAANISLLWNFATSLAPTRTEAFGSQQLFGKLVFCRCGSRGSWNVQYIGGNNPSPCADLLMWTPKLN